MGRTYIVEETVGQYLSSINLQGKPFVSGLLIGQVCICLLLCRLIKTNYSLVSIIYTIY
jgi:hypothetical protein